MCGLAEALDAAPELSLPQVKRESVHCGSPSARTVGSHSVLSMLTSKSKSPKGVLDVGEILTASDGKTDRPKVEPCSLAFYVSHVTGRVQVLDAAEQPMGFNFKLADWQAFQNGSALPPGLVSDPDAARCTETFLRSWPLAACGPWILKSSFSRGACCRTLVLGRFQSRACANDARSGDEGKSGNVLVDMLRGTSLHNQVHNVQTVELHITTVECIR